MAATRTTPVDPLKTNILAQRFTLIRDNRKSFTSIVKFANDLKKKKVVHGGR